MNPPFEEINLNNKREAEVIELAKHLANECNISQGEIIFGWQNRTISVGLLKTFIAEFKTESNIIVTIKYDRVFVGE